MKKYITLAAAITISLQAFKKYPQVVVSHETAKPVLSYHLHHAVWLILKKITNLDTIA
ncbi:MAG: hypothetical protein V4619_03790 [Bacteroidota bacterium]